VKLYTGTYQALALLEAPKIHTDVLWDLTILVGGIAFLYFTGIFIIKNRMSRKSLKKSNLKTELSPMISEFIFYDVTGSKEEKSIYINLKVKVRDMLKDDFKRSTISEILLELRKDVSGAAQQKLFELFQDLDLHTDSYKKLESWRWESISSGIQELTRMEVREAYGFLTKFVNDKRTTIRKQAEIAIVTLDSEGINYFLDTTRNKISEWQQLKLIEVLSNKTDFSPPSFKAWLVSKNKYVVLFALRLIKYYDQNDSSASIIELVKHQDEQIKEEAIDCIKAFHLTDALPTLTQWFWNCSTDSKINILDAIAVLGSQSDIPFLQSIQKKERNYSVTSKALSTINAIMPGTILPTEGIIDNQSITIPSDIIEEEVSKEALTVTPEKRIALAHSEEDKKQDSVEVQEFENVLVPDKIINTSTLESTINMAQEKKLTKKEKDLNDIEVEFSTCFIPIVTASEDELKSAAQQMESLVNDIDVYFEEVSNKYTPDATQTSTIDPNAIAVVVDLDFLPIVVANQEEVKETILLNEIEVVYEQIQVKTSTEEVNSEKSLVDIQVTYETLKVVALQTKQLLEDIEVIYEELVSDSAEISFDMSDDLKDHYDFEIIFNNGQSPLRIPKIDAANVLDIEVDVKELSTAEMKIDAMEVVFEHELGDDKSEDEELPQWLLNEIANESANSSKPNLNMEGPEWESKKFEMMDQIKGFMSAISPIGPGNEDLTDTMRLLDDIELFGDEREIALLQELMQKEDEIQTKDRIDGLMKRFMGTDAYGKGVEGTASYSVFEELFRNCDTESKLILLDEIVLIGDKKEVSFLEKLLNDPTETIRIKAAASLKLIKERLQRVAIGQESNDADEYERFINIMELKPPKAVEEPSYFKIDFEIDSQAEEKQEIEIKKQEKGFLNLLSNFFNKLINP